MVRKHELEEYDLNSEKDAFMAELESLRPDLIYAEGWSETERKEAVEMLRPNKVKANMLQAIPMRCRGSECDFAESCPLLKKNLAPVGKSCPIEQAAVLQLFTDYVEELEVDTSRMVEVSLVRDLVDQEIQQMRKTWMLSQESFIQENVAGIDSDGNVVTKKELHQAIDYEERLLKRKERLRNALVATREAKVRAGQGKPDSATVVANILEEVRKVENARNKALLKELGMSEDQYIDAELLDDESDDES